MSWEGKKKRGKNDPIEVQALWQPWSFQSHPNVPGAKNPKASCLSPPSTTHAVVLFCIVLLLWACEAGAPHPDINCYQQHNKEWYTAPCQPSHAASFYGACLNPPTILLQLHKILGLFSLMGMIWFVPSCLREQRAVLWDWKTDSQPHKGGADLGTWSGSFNWSRQDWQWKQPKTGCRGRVSSCFCNLHCGKG